MRTFDDGDGLSAGKRRHLILQLGQLASDIVWQQIAPRGKYLPEFDENRPQSLQRLAQTHGARRGKVPPKQQDT